LSWDGEEPATVEAEEAAPSVEEPTTEAQVATEPPAAEAPLPEAVVVEGKYSS
jgi:hypothetical protein